MKYLSLFLLLSASLTCAMEQNGDKGTHRTLSELTLILQQRGDLPPDMIATTQQAVFKQNDSALSSACYENKINERIIFCLEEPQIFPFDAHKIKQVAFTDSFLFLLGFDGAVECHYHNISFKNSDLIKAFISAIKYNELTYGISLHSSAIFFHGNNGYLSIEFNGNEPRLTSVRALHSPFIKQQDLKLITYKNTVWTPDAQQKDTYQPLSTKWSSIVYQSMQVPENKDLLFTNNYSILYEQTEPNEYTIVVHLITIVRTVLNMDSSVI
jgi:hypothetical protein